MYTNDELERELDYFKRMNEHFTINAEKGTVKVSNASKEILYMALSASLAMDITEDGFFEEFFITDKAISGKQDLQLDAYAFIETENSNERHLHLFQYKLYQNDGHAASPIDLMNFSTLMNNVFVHPELRGQNDLNNEVLKDIDKTVQTFLNGRRGRKIVVHCHFINNAKGVIKSNEKSIQDVLGRFEYDKQHGNFKIQVYGLQEILDLAIDGKIKVGTEDLEFVIDAPYNAYRYEDNTVRTGLGLPKKVFIGIANVNEFIRLQNKYHRNQLYAENIRLYLGDRAAVNKDIINTITSVESIWFPYMNNGISIICDELKLGSPNTQKKSLNIEVKNMQIINGCQTVNALYSARYHENTKDNFRASNVLVKIYQIDPDQQDFKTNVIKATNNQNAVKTYSLLANDPIQIKIEELLKKFNYLYDRKGEAKFGHSRNVVSMPNAALAYRAVFWYSAQSLRARIGQTRVFQKTEYEKIFNPDLLDDDNRPKLYKLASKLLVASIILDTIRDQITVTTETYIKLLPIFKKSAYYLAGYLYALNKDFFEKKIDDMVGLLNEDNQKKIVSLDIPKEIKDKTIEGFDAMVGLFTKFYDKLDLDKTDIDNLLKSKLFGDKYEAIIKEIVGEQPVDEASSL